MFSTSDEYETALIVERRAAGRYSTSRIDWAIVVSICCGLTIAGVALFAS